MGLWLLYTTSKSWSNPAIWLLRRNGQAVTYIFISYQTSLLSSNCSHGAFFFPFSCIEHYAPILFCGTNENISFIAQQEVQHTPTSFICCTTYALLCVCVYDYLYIKEFLQCLVSASGGCGSNCSGWMNEWMGGARPRVSVRSSADLRVTRRQLLVHCPVPWGDVSALIRQ